MDQHKWCEFGCFFIFTENHPNDVFLCKVILKDMSKLLLGFVEVVLCISSPLPNKPKLKFDKDFKAFCSFCQETKVFNAFGKVSSENTRQFI